MDESIPLQLASVNHMEVVAIHMIHLYRDPPGSRRGTGVGTDPVPASIAMAVSMHDGFMPCSYLINEGSLLCAAPPTVHACSVEDVVPSISVTDSPAWSDRCTDGYCRH